MILPLTAGLLLLAAPPPQAREAAPARAAPADAELRAAWGALSPELRAEAVEWLRAEVEHLGTFQAALLRHVLQTVERDPGTWPALEEPPLYDPERHAPAQPIRRRRLSPTSARAERLHERVFGRVPERELDSAWVYDYGARGLRWRADRDDPDRIFENALRGLAPDLDLVEALVELRLDDGAQRRALAAFGHAYADRSGAVAPGITLYDAWASGIEMEMPDVECLGVVHDVLDDWSTWTAPVPARRHDELYDRIGELFQDARRHRGLRHALARCYALDAPALRDGYSVHLDRFHAVWDLASSEPATLAAELPDVEGWKAWLQGWIDRVDGDPELRARALRRRATLAADRERVRDALVFVLRGLGALER